MLIRRLAQVSKTSKPSWYSPNSANEKAFPPISFANFSAFSIERLKTMLL